VGGKRWHVFATPDTVTAYAYRYGSKGQKAYLLRPTDLNWTRTEVYQIGGSCQIVSEFIASGAHKIVGFEPRD
jgi:hypothetical protein